MGRAVRVLAMAAFLAAAVLSAARAAPVESFAAFLEGFEPRAIAAGVPAGVYREATRGLTADPGVVPKVTAQPEFSTPVWDYLDRRVSAGRIARGRAAMAKNATLFARIGGQYGVDPAVLGAIWGMETDYGGVLGNTKLIKPIVRSLATLVHHRRGRLKADEEELLAALILIARGQGTAQSLTGSWAGALGHLQVGPSVLIANGTDGDGDGAVDVHRSLADALATSAVFLKSIGYRSGSDWGYEVSLPEGFDHAIASRNEFKRAGFFAERGVRRVKGREFYDLDEPVFLYVPAGQTGPKFLMTSNYLVLKGYNFSDSYALAVAHLTDRLKGSGPFVQSWPRQTRFPNRAQRIAVQEMLRKLGFYRDAVDGRLGPKSQEAYQKFQTARGLVADGFITLEAYRALREATR